MEGETCWWRGFGWSSLSAKRRIAPPRRKRIPAASTRGKNRRKIRVESWQSTRQGEGVGAAVVVSAEVEVIGRPDVLAEGRAELVLKKVEVVAVVAVLVAVVEGAAVVGGSSSHCSLCASKCVPGGHL